MCIRKRIRKGINRNFCILLTVFLFISVFWKNTDEVYAVEIAAPSAILVEATTGQVIYELNATERRSPASITKIMTLLLTFERLKEGKLSLQDQVITSAHAKSMSGSKVFLEEGEVQTLETMIKCIAVSSGNDASVAVAEHIAGSEEAFVGLMNEKAVELGMQDTNFEDCSGLTSSDGHYTTARDVAVMSRELTQKYPEVFQYTKIWMEDITHVTRQGTSNFTLSSTNKLLKQYEWATGLKTGSTSKAKYCLSATATKEGVDLIAVVMGAPDYKVRFQDAKILLNYGFSVSKVYVDENKEEMKPLKVCGGKKKEVSISAQGAFRYLDIQGNDLNTIEKKVKLPQEVKAPVKQGELAGSLEYYLNQMLIGSVPILYGEDVPEAKFFDYFKKMFGLFLL